MQTDRTQIALRRLHELRVAILADALDSAKHDLRIVSRSAKSSTRKPAHTPLPALASEPSPRYGGRRR